jgi:hypothetical protein
MQPLGLSKAWEGKGSVDRRYRATSPLLSATRQPGDRPAADTLASRRVVQACDAWPLVVAVRRVILPASVMLIS